MSALATAVLESVTDKDLRDLLAEVEESGWSFERGGSGHWKILNSEGELVTTASATASDYRSIKNLRAKLKRKGMKKPEVVKPPIERPDLDAIDLRLQEEQAAVATTNGHANGNGNGNGNVNGNGNGSTNGTPVEKDPDLRTMSLRPSEKVEELLRRAPLAQFKKDDIARLTGLDESQVTSTMAYLAKHRPDIVRRVRRGVYQYANVPSSEEVVAQAKKEHEARLAAKLEQQRREMEEEQRRQQTMRKLGTDKHGRVVLIDAEGELWVAITVEKSFFPFDREMLRR